MRTLATGIVVMLALAAPARAAGAAPDGARQPIKIRVSQTEFGRPIHTGFLGISMEYSSLYAYAGDDPRAVNPVFTQLIANLSGGRGATLRFGGDSADRTWWPVRGMPTPPWVAYTLTPHWTAAARAVAGATGARLILGINLLADSPSVASTEGKALVSGIGRTRIRAFEIGNEPELYSTQPWYWSPSGKPVTGRPRSYSFQRYLAEVSSIRRVLPPMALAGPATGTVSWLSHLSALQSVEPGLKQVTFHRYPLNRCVHNPRSPRYPSVSHLLSSEASAGLVGGLARWVALAHRRRKTFRVDELNAVTCGGMHGVSNTFASALWALDTEFWMLSAGVDGVDVHVHPEAPANQLFTFERQNGRWTGVVRPQYYGLLLFARAAPPGVRLLRVTGAGSGPLRVWATLGRDGRVRIVLINRRLRGVATVVVQPPTRPGAATIERLRALSVHATGGVSLGGQSFGSHTTSGALVDRALALSEPPGRGGYRVQMPAASAAMLTISPERQRRERRRYAHGVGALIWVVGSFAAGATALRAAHLAGHARQ